MNSSSPPPHRCNWQFACQLREDEMMTFISEDTLTIKALSKRPLPYVKRKDNYKILFFCGGKSGCGAMKTVTIGCGNYIQGTEVVNYNL